MSRGNDPTAIGRVRHVLGATVTVELDAELAGVTPLWRGHLVPIGQVGSLIRIPQGQVSLLGSVTLVGISELTTPPAPSFAPQQGDRWLQVQLLGEIDALGVFRRGVSSYPGLDDTVHFATSEDLIAAYPPGSADRLVVGTVASSADIPVSLAVAPMVTRHSAIVGSTGSGKTSAVSSLLQSLVAGGWSSANVLVIDPHGEYGAALGTSASVRSVLGSGDGALRVPYWALSASDLLLVLCDVSTRTVLDKFSELVVQERRRFAAAATWLDLNEDEITAETPVPYDLRQVWHDLDYANRVTVRTQGGAHEVVTRGHAATLTPTEFQPYAAGGAAPFKGPTFGHFSPAAERLRLRLRDPKYQFILDIPDPNQPDPLVDNVSSWLGGVAPISVLDFAGVPADVADVAIGVILKLLFDLSTQSTSTDGVGRGRPVLVALEEAHRYLSEAPSTGLARAAVNRIAREGRKYGVGLCLVTQRPSELPETALSQCGTIISLRLTNSADQATVRSALPDAVAALASVLPSLRTGEALISGEAIALPTRTALRRPDPEPRAADASLDGWRMSPAATPIVDAVVERWRNSQTSQEKNR